MDGMAGRPSVTRFFSLPTFACTPIGRPDRIYSGPLDPRMPSVTLHGRIYFLKLFFSGNPTFRADRLKISIVQPG